MTSPQTWMGRTCIVCKSSRISGKKPKSFFKPPSFPEKRKIWEKNLNRALKNSNYICEFHFKEEDIVREKVFYRKDNTVLTKVPLKSTRLVDHAVPFSSQPPSSGPFEKRSSCENNVLEKSESLEKRPFTENVVEGTKPSEKRSRENRLTEKKTRYNPAEIYTTVSNAEILLPSAWSKVLLDTGDIVFATFTINKLSNVITKKEVRLSKDGKITFWCYGKQIEIDEIVMTADDLRRTICSFDDSVICKGIGVLDSKSDYRNLTIDVKGTHRHKSCPMILQENDLYVCEFCQDLNV
ncbi:uncharacterized protein LOC135123100 isoform X1 [Zophobas morio]|uniref:uncharacterized protein LOC135123100 isoform X1 n=1 Tax=Zophobas morio TaxID=2755281 RepID=UPI0030838ABD